MLSQLKSIMQKIKYGGKTYKSLEDLCQTWHRSLPCVEKCINLGASIEEALHLSALYRRRDIKEIIHYRNAVFPNKLELLRFYDIGKWIIEYNLKHHCDTFLAAVDRALDPPPRSVHTGEFVVFGQTYPTIRAVADAFNISAGILWYKVRDVGLSVEEAVRQVQSGLNKVKRGFEFEGKLYPCRADAARAFGLTEEQMKAVVEKRAVLEHGQYVSLKKKSLRVTIDGITYDNCIEAAKALNISERVVRQCIKYGITDSATILDKTRRLAKIRTHGVLYKVTNSVTGKVYIGISLVSTASRMKSHMHKARTNPSSPMYQDYHKYGEQSFKVRTLRKVDNVNELKQLEVFYIKKYKSLVPNGYNQNRGGAINDYLLLEKRRITYKGVTYNNSHTLCSYLKISHAAFTHLYNDGHSVAYCVKKATEWTKRPKRVKRRISAASQVRHGVFIRGMGTLPLEQACKHYGISYHSAYYCIRARGMQAKEAVDFCRKHKLVPMKQRKNDKRRVYIPRA